MYSRLLNDLLGAITKDHVNRMIYKNFDEHITRKHGIVIEGWPLHTFENPSSIGSQMELKVLLNAWKTGATRFRKMTVEEHLAWIENRANNDPPSSVVVHPPPASSLPSPMDHGYQDLAPATTPWAPDTPFNVIDFGSPATPPTGTTSTNSIPKKTRKVRSDRGKPRKKAAQIPGVNVFHTSAL